MISINDFFIKNFRSRLNGQLNNIYDGKLFKQDNHILDFHTNDKKIICSNINEDIYIDSMEETKLILARNQFYDASLQISLLNPIHIFIKMLITLYSEQRKVKTLSKKYNIKNPILVVVLFQSNYYRTWNKIKCFTFRDNRSINYDDIKLKDFNFVKVLMKLDKLYSSKISVKI